MNRLMVKAGLGVLAAGTLATAGALALSSGGDAAKPAVSVTQRAAHGSNADFNGRGPYDPVFLGSFPTQQDCDNFAATAQHSPGVNIVCQQSDQDPNNPFVALSVPTNPNPTGPSDGSPTGPDASQHGQQNPQQNTQQPSVAPSTAADVPNN